MAFGTRFRRFSGLLALLWVMLPALGAAQCGRALPPPVRPASVPPVKPAATPRCPLCARMSMPGMQMPGMQGMKCCCHTGGPQLSCRCGVQPSPKPTTIALLLWSPLAVLPARFRLSPPGSAACVYPALCPRLAALCLTPPPRPPRFL